MQKYPSYLFTIIFFILLLISCSKESENSSIPSNQAKLSVYKNQSGDPNSDGLQAQYIGANDEYTLNFYGTYDNDNLPNEINTITYQKKGNDTIVNLILEPFTKKIVSSVISVRGIKSSIVMKYDYFADNPSAIAVSFYNYNWSTNDSELIHTSRFENDNGTYSSTPVFANRNINGVVGDMFAAGLSGIVFAEVFVATVGQPGAFSLLPYISTAGTAILASATASAIVAGVAIGVTIVALSAILSPVFASELTPVDSPYPTGTPALNPILPNNNPVPNLQFSACMNTNIRFQATMDSVGSIMFWGVSGGQAPYTYFVNSSSQQNEVFGNNYPDGSYIVGVRDATGCVSVRNIHLTRNLNSPKWYVGTYTLQGASPGAQLDGQSGQIYTYVYYTRYDSNDLNEEPHLAYVTYVKSIIPGMPSFYYKRGGFLVPNADHPIALLHRNDTQSGGKSFSIYMELSNGIAMTTANTTDYPYSGSRVTNFGDFYYFLNLQANFNLQSPPVGLSLENNTQINAMIASDELDMMIDE